MTVKEREAVRRVMTEMRIHYWKRVKEAIKYYDLVGQDLSILSEDEKHLV